MQEDDCMPVVAKAPTTDLFRVGMLVVGFPRQPFTIQVTHENQSIIDLPLSDHIKLPTHAPPRFLCRSIAGSVEIRFFRAIRRGLPLSHTPSRYLQLGDPDIDQLIQADNEDALSTFINPANEICQYVDLSKVLKAEPTSNWTPQSEGEEIQVLVVIGVKGKSQAVDNDIHLFRVTSYQRPQLCYSGQTEMMFHRHPWPQSKRRLRLLSVVHPGSDSECSIDKLPAFDFIQLERRYCMKPPHWKPSHFVPPPKSPIKKKKKKIEDVDPWTKQLKDPNPWRKLSNEENGRISPPRLSELAESVVYHTLFSKSPQFLDPVDCVMEASLYLQKEKVLENVLCFVKFQRPDLSERPKTTLWSDYVNPRMLEHLRSIARVGDWRPCLMVFIATTNPQNAPIHEDSIPTSIPTIVVDRRDYGRVYSGEAWAYKRVPQGSFSPPD